MARIRYLKPEFFIDEDLKNMPYEARIFFAGLWCHADKAGRLEDRPERLKAQIMPYDKIDPEKILSLLAKHKTTNRPFIQRYNINGDNYIQILAWEKHQKPHHTEKDSIIPPPNNPPTKDKENGDGECSQRSTELSNGEVTVKKPLITISDEDFLKNLKEKYGWADLDTELQKMDAWLLANPHRKKTRRFIVNWLNHIEKPINTNNNTPIFRNQ